MLLAVADEMRCTLGEVLELPAVEVLARAAYYRIRNERIAQGLGRRAG